MERDAPEVETLSRGVAFLGAKDGDAAGKLGLVGGRNLLTCCRTGLELPGTQPQPAT